MLTWLLRWFGKTGAPRLPEPLPGPPRVLYGTTAYGWSLRYVDPDPLTRYRPLTQREIDHLRAYGWC